MYGGEISFICQGGGQYEFTLKLYHSCNSVGLAPTEQISGPQGTIVLYPSDSGNVVPSCFDPNATGCAGSVYAGVAWTAYTGTTTLTGTPPANGWDFSWSSCCRKNSVDNVSGSPGGYFFRTSMYPDPSNNCSSSAQWSKMPPGINTGPFELNNFAFAPGIGDSLFFRLVDPMTSMTSTQSFASGYSASAPFPDASEDPNNGPVIFDPATGSIKTNISSSFSAPTQYVYAMEVENWRKGHLVGVAYRDFVQVLAPQLFGTNNYVTAVIDTALWNFKSVSGKPLVDGLGNYHFAVYPGDNLTFEMSAQDFDYNVLPSGGLIPQNIIFSAFGSTLDSLTTTFNKIPRLTPKAPQSGFSQALNNNIIFSWSIDTEHVNGPFTSYWFQFEYRDDFCPVGLSSYLNVEIVVMDTASVIDLDEFNHTDWSVFPNPATDVLNFTGVETGSEVRIMDMSGKLLRSEILSDERVLSVIGLSPGIYLLEVKGSVLKLRVD